MEAKLPALFRGEAEPGVSAAERLVVAKLATAKGWYARAAYLADAAFKAQPAVADDMKNQPRYDAACAAALAGCGQGKDDPPPDDEARRGLRRQALGWLQADLAAWSREIQKGSGCRSSENPPRHAPLEG